ncbi:MAG: VWA domain-containing protein, partial [Halomonadaceae bacterium]
MLILLFQPVFAAQSSAESTAAIPAPSENLDLRLIIDISGSMRRTDPNNLRQPAVTLFSELVPEDSKAGVWTFGRYVNMLVPNKPVDEAWRSQVKAAAEKINSVALFTNIGGALEVASDDFYQDRDFSNTHFILLTDGLVNIDPSEAADRAERERILGPVLERFVEQGARIHPIALSDEADFPLLETLAVRTGGQFNIAHTDAELTKAMLQAFAGSASSDEVPLADNQFTIDSTVEQFTALIFRDPGADSIRLQTPSGNTLNRSDRKDNLRWLSTREYDLITLDQPEEGEWQVSGLIGTDSRIKVVSQLRMVVSQLPRQFFASDTLPLSIAFYEDGELITDQELLALMELTVEISTAEGRSGTRVVSGPASAAGVFRDDIKLLRDPGMYQVMVRADGGTFNRSHRQTTTLRPPFDVELQGQGSGNNSAYQLLLRPRDPGLDLSTVNGELTLTMPDGAEERRNLVANENRTEWATELTGQAGPGDYRLALSIEGKTQQGLTVGQTMDTVLARFPRDEERSSYARVTAASTLAPVADVVEPLPEPSEPQVSQDPRFSPEPVTVPQPADTAIAEPPETDEPIWRWWWLAIIILLLLPLLGGLWWWRKKASQGDNKPTSDNPESRRDESGQSAAVDRDNEDAIAPLTSAIATLDHEQEDDLLTGEPPELSPMADETAPDSLDLTEPSETPDSMNSDVDVPESSEIPELSSEDSLQSESDPED